MIAIMSVLPFVLLGLLFALDRYERRLLVARSGTEPASAQESSLAATAVEQAEANLKGANERRWA